MTITEIAQLAGVSVSTVSKIINNKDSNISAKTRTHVLQIVKEYNYSPYSSIKNTSQAKTFTLAVLLKDIKQKHQTIISGILRTAQKSGYNIMVFDSQNDISAELKHITSICKNKIDGVIWEPINNKSFEFQHYFTKQHISILWMNASNEAPFYKIDFRRLSYDLTKIMLDYGHTMIGYLSSCENDLSESDTMLEGFKQCLFDNRITFDEKMLLSDTDQTLIQKIMNYHITGVISAHFFSSLRLYQKAENTHYRIPYDLSLLTLKDFSQAKLPFPSISGIEIPYQKFGEYICDEIIRLCENKEAANADITFTAENSLDNDSSIAAPSSLKKRKIAVVGSINIDTTFNVAKLPQAGRTTKILNTFISAGGKGANQAIGVSRLGNEVSLIGEVGNDIDATLIFDILDQEKISTKDILQNSQFQTGKAYIYLDPSGESVITILEGANSALSVNALLQHKDLFKNAGYCLLSTEIALPIILKAAELAKNCGAINIVKPAAQYDMPESLFPLTDIFVPNQKEARLLCPRFSSIEKQAEYFYQKGIPIVIITLGEQGCYLKTSRFADYFSAPEFTSIDTTGGSDAFISALSSYMTNGYSIEKAIRIASYAAGFCISHRGVVPALVEKQTLESYIQKLEPNLLQ